MFKISHYLVQISLWYIQIKKNISRDCQTVGFCQSWCFFDAEQYQSFGWITFHTVHSMNSIFGGFFLWNGTTCDLLTKAQLFAILNALFLITNLTQNFSLPMSEWFQNFPRTFKIAGWTLLMWVLAHTQIYGNLLQGNFAKLQMWHSNLGCNLKK